MGITGIMIRSAMVLAWLGAIALQVVIAHVAASGDLRGAQRHWQGTRLVYALAIEDQAGLSRPLGTCRWQSDAQGRGSRVDCAVIISDVRAIPGIAPVLPFLAQLDPVQDDPRASAAVAAAVTAAAHPGPAGHHRPPPVMIQLTQLSGADGVVESLSGGASYGDLDATFAAHFLDQELQVSWQAPMFSGHRSFPPLHGVRSWAVIGLLPSGIRAGRRFSIPMLGTDVSGLTPRLNQISFHCTGEEELVTNLGAALLCRVEEEGQDHRLAATLWCDDSGLVYRQRWEDFKVTLELTRTEHGPVATHHQGPDAAPQPSPGGP